MLSAICQIYLIIQPIGNEMAGILRQNNKTGVWHGVWCIWGYTL